MFGTILENVVLDERGVLDLDDDSKTENTRAAYKLEQIPNALPTKRAGHPLVVFLTADAFGVLPPIARLPASRRGTTSSPDSRRSSQAPRLASPSRSRRSLPASARRSCRSRRVYARLLGEKLDQHGSRCGS